jgi:hypothetical protein
MSAVYSRKSQAGDLQPSCSEKMRRGGLQQFFGLN